MSPLLYSSTPVEHSALMRHFPRLVNWANNLKPWQVAGWEWAWGMWFVAALCAFIADGFSKGFFVLVAAVLMHFVGRITIFASWILNAVIINNLAAFLFFTEYVPHLF